MLDTEWFCGVHLLLSKYGNTITCYSWQTVEKMRVGPYGSKLLTAELGFNRSLSHCGMVKSSLKSPALPKGPECMDSGVSYLELFLITGL